MKKLLPMLISALYLTCSCIDSFATSLYSNEYSFTEVLDGHHSTQAHLNSINAFNIYTDVVCRENCEKNCCWSVLKNHKGDIVKQYSTDDVVSTIASARYHNKAYIIAKRSWKCGDKNCSETYLFDEKGNKQEFILNNPEISIDKIITLDKKLVVLTQKAIVIIDKDGNILRMLEAPQLLETGILRNNPDGTIMALAVDKTNTVLACDLSGWITTPLKLSEHGDRTGVLGAYPDNANVIYGAVYRYINEYNKGIYIVKVDFKNKECVSGVLFNSQARNIGFDPDIHTENNTVVVTAKNSSEDKMVHFRIPLDDVDSMEDKTPDHAIGFENEKNLSFLLGSGVSKNFWITKSKVEKDDTKYMGVEYDVSESMFYMTQFEGRFRNTQLALTYMRNQAEKFTSDKIEDNIGGGTVGETLSKKASSQIFSTLDFHGLISGSSSLRVVFENSDIKGVAKLDGDEIEVGYEDISSKYTRFSCLVMKERGYYYGGEYVNYQMPSAVGFESPDGTIRAYFDKGLKVNSISGVVGYDMLSYARRYETNFHKFYFSGNGGVGLGFLSISDEIENQAEADFNNSADTPLFIVLDGMLEVGYIIQHRLKFLKGCGYQINFGYRGKGVYMTAGGRSDESESEKLSLIWDKYDLLHGPFIQGSLIF